MQTSCQALDALGFWGLGALWPVGNPAQYTLIQCVCDEVKSPVPTAVWPKKQALSLLFLNVAVEAVQRV